jgi:hypothetical protein
LQTLLDLCKLHVAGQLGGLDCVLALTDRGALAEGVGALCGALVALHLRSELPNYSVLAKALLQSCVQTMLATGEYGSRAAAARCPGPQAVMQPLAAERSLLGGSPSPHAAHWPAAAETLDLLGVEAAVLTMLRKLLLLLKDPGGRLLKEPELLQVGAGWPPSELQGCAGLQGWPGASWAVCLLCQLTSALTLSRQTDHPAWAACMQEVFTSTTLQHLLRCCDIPKHRREQLAKLPARVPDLIAQHMTQAGTLSADVLLLLLGNRTDARLDILLSEEWVPRGRLAALWGSWLPRQSRPARLLAGPLAGSCVLAIAGHSGRAWS